LVVAFARRPQFRRGALLEYRIGEAGMTPNPLPRDASRQLALFVGGGSSTLAFVEPILKGRAYDVEFVDTDDEPYATVAALKPDIVIVSLNIDNPAGFQLLTMLRLDPATAQIPVLSYVQETEASALGNAGVDHGALQLRSPHAPRAQRH
jgi:PleD family two-component response regulator